MQVWFIHVIYDDVKHIEAGKAKYHFWHIETLAICGKPCVSTGAGWLSDGTATWCATTSCTTLARPGHEVTMHSHVACRAWRSLKASILTQSCWLVAGKVRLQTSIPFCLLAAQNTHPPKCVIVNSSSGLDCLRMIGWLSLLKIRPKPSVWQSWPRSSLWTGDNSELLDYLTWHKGAACTIFTLKNCLAWLLIFRRLQC